MSSIQIKSVSSKSDVMKFIKFQWEVYKDFPNWVPPLLMDRKKILSKEKNPFFKHAEMELWLAYKDNKIVGRIAAIVNYTHNEIHKDKVGFFGFYESFNDYEVCKALMDTAADWLKSRGMDTMRGPANPSSNDDWGMVIEGFDIPPMLLMPYTPPYYINLMEQYGCTKAKDLIAFLVENDKINQVSKLRRVADIAQKRHEITIEQLKLKEIKTELKKIKELYNAAWEANWGFVPLTEEEIDAVADDLKPLVEETLVLFAYVKGQLAGFTLTMLDWNMVFKKMNGRLLTGFWRLFTDRKKITQSRIITLGLKPEFQRLGVDAVLYREIIDRAQALNIYLGEASWVLEDNQMMVRAAEMMQSTPYKKYRVFDKSL